MFFTTETNGEYHGTASADVFVFTSNFGAPEFFGGAGNDLLIGGGQSSWLYGEGGCDRLIAGSGSNFLDGGGGADTLIGSGAYTDMIGGAGRDVFAPFLNGWTSIDDFEHGVDKIRIPAGFQSRVHYRAASEGLFVGGVEIGTVETNGHAAHVTYADFLFV